MNGFDLTFHHLGLATRHPDIAELFLQGLGYTIGESIFDPEQNVHLKLAEHRVQPFVEIVYAADSPGPLTSILKTNHSLMYHTCYSCLSPELTIKKIKQTGIRVITVSEPKPAILFNGQLVSFYMLQGFGLVEILHSV